MSISPARQRGFFETPHAVACELASLAFSRCDAARIEVLDACSGRGALASAALEIALPSGRLSKLTLVEQDRADSADALRRLDGAFLEVKALNDSVFSRRCRDATQTADIILCNPPFKSWKNRTEEERIVLRSYGLPHYNDLSCAVILELLRFAKPRAVFAIIIRQDCLYSAGYFRFQSALSEALEDIDIRPLRKPLIRRSGAAKAVMIVGRVVRLTESYRRATRGPRPADALCHIASVRAGPSMRSGADQGNLASALASVIDIPRAHSGDVLWHASFATMIRWDRDMFSVPRNIDAQGLPGIVYRLAGYRFRTVILPVGVNFLSATPAIQPREARDLDFVTGCSLLPAWKSFVRSVVRSTNFTPGAVGGIPTPFLDRTLYDRLSEIGSLARSKVETARCDGGSAAQISLRGHLKDLVARADHNVEDWLRARSSPMRALAAPHCPNPAE